METLTNHKTGEILTLTMSDGQAAKIIKEVYRKPRNSFEAFLVDLTCRYEKGWNLPTLQRFWLHKKAIEQESHYNVPVIAPAPMPPAKVWEPLNFSSDLKEMLLLAEKTLKRPRIQFTVGDYTVRVELSKPNWRTGINKNEGGLYVCGLNREFYGAILADGDFHAGRDLNQTIFDFLKKLSEGPVFMVREQGRKTGVCGFCWHKLTDERSTEAGYGPICAEHFGLPW